MTRPMLFIFMGILAFVFLFPVLIIFTNSFMGGFEIFTRFTHTVRPGNYLYVDGAFHFVRITAIPDFVSFGQYTTIFFRHITYLVRYWNSIGLAIPILVGQLLISAPAAYAFEMSRLRCKEWIYLIYIVVMLMPLQVTLVPNFLMADWIGLLDSRWAIILPGMVNPFGVFIMRQFLRNLPRDYTEAAQIDGAGHLRAFALVIAPLFKPALAALAMLTFVENWNLVEAPRIFLLPTQEPLSLYLVQMATANMEMIFAASFFYLLPCVLIFLYGQEFMVEGIQLSGIK